MKLSLELRMRTIVIKVKALSFHKMFTMKTMFFALILMHKNNRPCCANPMFSVQHGRFFTVAKSF